jgi:hypothetical protein
MRSPLPYLFGSTSAILLSITSAIAPVLAEKAFVPAHRYPEIFIEAFMQGCMKTKSNINPKFQEQFCYCASNAIQDQYTLEEIFSLSREIRVNRRMPEEMKEVSVGCSLAVLKANSNR